MRRLAIGAAFIGLAGFAPLPAAAPSKPATASVAVHRDACGPILKKGNGTRWRCSFVDNFRGTKLNRDKWTVQDTARSRFTTGITCYVDSPDNVRVHRGKLRLTTRRRSLFLCGASRAFLTNFTGGMVGTKGYFSQAYGRFEVRAKFPRTNVSGLHGGFWMFPADRAYGRWPASGEIDVSEWWSYAPHVTLASLHYNGRTRRDSSKDCRTRTPAKFHRYTVLWSPRIMRFYIDGRRCFARRWSPDAPQHRPQPFDQPFSMLLNMGVTQYARETRIYPNTKFPSTFVVAYAKAWR